MPIFASTGYGEPQTAARASALDSFSEKKSATHTPKDHAATPISGYADTSISKFRLL